MVDYLKLILNARVYDILQQTPLTKANNLSNRLGCNIHLKREDLHPVFSFKCRGAYNFMAHIPKDDRWRGVITCSAGNHAQGVALAGSHLDIPCTILMPKNTPSIKWKNVERLGAKVILHGDNFDEAKAECFRLVKDLALTYVPPYDDPYVIAGQGTAAVELTRQIDMSTVDSVFCSVGGGGLISGMSEYIKRIAPEDVKMIGAETFDGDALDRSIKAGHRVTLDDVGTFSDGTAVRIVGEEPFRICQKLVDHIQLVDNDAICAAIKDVFEDTRSIPEPAGALAVAALKSYVYENNLINSGKTFVAVISGANMNFDRLRFVAERASLGEGKECMLSVTIPDQPGMFVKLHSAIHPLAVTEFVYRYADDAQSKKQDAVIFCSFSLPSASASLSPSERQLQIGKVINDIREQGFDAVDVSDNDLAKSHARYLIGGRSSCPSERLISFEFPERPNALKKFLTALNPGWNISLFHYRNLGGDVSKVLTGIQVPESDNDAFDKSLKDLDYHYVDETNNFVYQRFMRF
ncbi:threonine dehydratase I [Wallemia mellicola]|uniref:Threonine dehydratase n=2 Tax=Wallemia mellicola TaxID=1708541 RepID=A0A4T0R9Y7_9BASI|nr:threonine dehydratase I [Wallemia mellicola CBS 633.66]TIB72409.1 hypothetical protein E3Q24_01692 [Wallemia mellicola]EIM21810.1 threonine dehydratase I [Wallemia mellicola CBS 633.66]TIB74883.1 hypothetical protein E3Q23_02585 [Wallemia mellicola]TIB76848.1 threonine dehydratase I [Wallemia mellicola]TIB83517.1 threonine dehydratase I [Wallemia mellicola]|eukprot:XP_006958114.1 threonine dehydratase I [Wallemia mellicola CBS 633.66]